MAGFCGTRRQNDDFQRQQRGGREKIRAIALIRFSAIYKRRVIFFTTDQKEQLVSVLVDTEQSCLSKITGKPRFNIKKAIESGDINALQQEQNNLLGDETKAGELNHQLRQRRGRRH